MTVLEFIFGVIMLIICAILVLMWLAFKYDQVEKNNEKEKEIKKMYKDFKKVNKKSIKNKKGGIK